MSRHYRVTVAVVAFTFAAHWSASPFSLAATHTWTGASLFGNNWTDTANWSLFDAPNSDGSDAIQFSPCLCATTSTVDVNHNIHGILFHDNTFTAPVYTIDGSGTLAFKGSGAYLDNYSVKPQYISAPIRLDSPVLSVRNKFAELPDSRGRLTIYSAINTNGKFLNVYAGSSGIEIDGVISGSGHLVKYEPGALILYGANTYTGDTTIYDGLLRLGHNNVLPDTTDLSIDSGTLEMFDNTDTIRSLNLFNSGDVGAVNDTLVLSSDGSALNLFNGADLTDPDLFLQLSSTSVFAGVSAYAGSPGPGPGPGVFSDVNANLRLGSTTKIFTVTVMNTSPGGVDLRWDGVISQAGGIQKTDDGTLQLTAANTYEGGTTIAKGRLRVSNTSGSATGTGFVVVNNGGTLEGGGSIAGPTTVNNGGTVAPGASTGKLTLASVQFLSGSKLAVEVAGDGGTAGTDFDQLFVNGTATLGGTLSIDLLGSFLPDLGDLFPVLSATTLSSAFSNVANGARLGTLGGQGSFVVNYGASSAFDPNQVVLSAFVVLPGDFNENGIVDAGDYTFWRNNLGAPAGTLDNDVDGGVIGQAQYNTWKANFGATSGSGSAASDIQAVPEPTTSILTILAAACCFVRRRRAT